MALIPTAAQRLPTFGGEVEVQSQAEETSRTYAVNWHTGRIGGVLDGPGGGGPDGGQKRFSQRSCSPLPQRE